MKALILAVLAASALSTATLAGTLSDANMDKLADACPANGTPSSGQMQGTSDNQAVNALKNCANGTSSDPAPAAGSANASSAPVPAAQQPPAAKKTDGIDASKLIDQVIKLIDEDDDDDDHPQKHKGN